MPRTEFSLEQVCDAYRLRWQVELFVQGVEVAERFSDENQVVAVDQLILPQISQHRFKPLAG
ncbi:MAG TPA: hypothetical protein ENJ43_05150 [Gammaproteobacteria bacterium]|nr:hypothetical protein [Gammaproteobacteria bacterium]